MRPTRPMGALIGLTAICSIAAGCGGAAKHSTSTPAPAASVAPHLKTLHVRFLAPAQGAVVGSTVTARIALSGKGSVRFILDRGRPRTVHGLSVTYRHLTAGHHRLVAQIMSSAGKPTEAAVTFKVRQASVASPAPAIRTPRATATTPASTPPAAAVRPAPAAPPVRSAPPPPRAIPSPPAGGGIPQGGGGDGDADNHGGPSDGDGNV